VSYQVAILLSNKLKAASLLNQVVTHTHHHALATMSAEELAIAATLQRK